MQQIVRMCNVILKISWQNNSLHTNVNNPGHDINNLCRTQSVMWIKLILQFAINKTLPIKKNDRLKIKQKQKQIKMLAIEVHSYFFLFAFNQTENLNFRLHVCSLRMNLFIPILFVEQSENCYSLCFNTQDSIKRPRSCEKKQ